MDEWVTLLLRRRDALVCDMCAKAIENEEVHLYVNRDYEIDKVVCEKCWNEEQINQKGEEKKIKR